MNHKPDCWSLMPDFDYRDCDCGATALASAELEWKMWRRGGVGGSDIAALLGLSSWASPTSLYYDKVGELVDDDQPDTERQRIGKRMETVLALEFNDRTGLYVAGEQTRCEHGLFTWARCTVDGFVQDSPFGSPGVDGDLALGTVQMKTDGRFGWPDGIPPAIRAQCVWEMGVTDHLHCWLIVMFAGFRVEVFELDWDADAHSDWMFMLDVARDFWENHVLPRVPPPVDDHWATTAALTAIHAGAEGYIDAGDDDRELVARILRSAQLTAAVEATEQRYRNELRARLGDHTDLVDGWVSKGVRNPKLVPVVLASWREQTATKIDPELVRALVPAELVEKCSKQTTSRVLRVNKPKEK